MEGQDVFSLAAAGGREGAQFEERAEQWRSNGEKIGGNRDVARKGLVSLAVQQQVWRLELYICMLTKYISFRIPPRCGTTPYRLPVKVSDRLRPCQFCPHHLSPHRRQGLAPFET
jgi:hypothetical protein